MHAMSPTSSPRAPSPLDVLSHEVRTSLEAIRSIADRLAREVQDDSLRDDLRRLSEASHMVQERLGAASEGAADTSPKWVEFDLGALGREVSEFLAPMARDRSIEV